MDLPTPSDCVSFDTLLTRFADALWQEGEPRGLLANVLCGLTHEVPSLHGRLHAAWRLHATWLKLEPASRAPPLTARLAQAFAGGFLKRGHVMEAGAIILGFHCLLRNCEFMQLRCMDISIFPGLTRGQLRLVHTKIGQRLGITEQVSVTDDWVLTWLAQYRRARAHTARCVRLNDYEFRRIWSQVRSELRLPDAFTPYGVRRGGATHFFQECGSFSLTSDRGRWGTERATRIYVTSALQDLAALEEVGPQVNRLAASLQQLHVALERMTPQAAKSGARGAHSSLACL